MTCIVALETPSGVWIGADSQIGEWCRESLAVPKICEAAPGVVFGIAGIWRTANVLRHRWRPDPPAVDADIDEWMFDAAEDFRRLLNDHGAAKQDNAQQHMPNGNGEAIVVAGGRAYSIGPSFSYYRSSYGYTAIGGGEPFALGSFATTERMGLPADDRIRFALDAAARHNNGVSEPFTVRFVGRQ